MEEYLLPCMFKSLFGIDCIGCGIQRATILVFQGQFKSAFEMYPAIYTTLLLFLLLALHIFDKKHQYHKFVIATAILNALVMLISYAIKMNLLIN